MDKLSELPIDLFGKILDDCEIKNRINIYLSKKDWYNKYWIKNDKEKKKFINEDFRCVICKYSGCNQMYVFLCKCMFRKPITHAKCYDECYEKYDEKDISKIKRHRNGYDYMKCPNCNKMAITLYIPFLV